MLFLELLHLVLHPGKGKAASVAFHTEHIPELCLTAQFIQLLPRWKGQPQKLTGAVNQLTGGDVRGAAQLGAGYVLPLRLYKQQLRGAPGQMPGKMWPIHDIQPSGAP